MELIYIFYKLSLLFCAVYGFHRLFLAITASRFLPQDPLSLKTWDRSPFVTIQLPVYNEYFVIKQLLESVSKIDYPRALLEIQVLDDSTDETTILAQDMVEQLKSQGLNIELIHRQRRDGYKAGALANGLLKAQGEFVAVFDADFIPSPDFLKRTIDYFTDESVGMVQARWAHQNPDDSLLTRLQSVLIDGHFLVDQFARFSSGKFFNFNGSAGIWRRRTIDEAGGWQADTLAEDLDLSYRAQMQGWKFVLLSNYQVKQELPKEITAFKQQQYRWSKGSLQVGCKLLPKIWKSSSMPLKVKLEATFHLTNTFAYVFVLMTSLVTLPIILGPPPVKDFLDGIFVDAGLFIAGMGSLIFYYVISQKRQVHNWMTRLWFFPFFISGIAGFSLVYIKAILEVLMNKRTPFIRTPKKGSPSSFGPNTKVFYKVAFDPYFIGEIFMAGYLTVVLYMMILKHHMDMAAFLVLIVLGYYYVIIMSLLEWLPARIDPARVLRNSTI
jgi:cellulose synthase/poly-beta-1,6-N-acetylglucosamine synthase-like glycosyltransferase